MNFDPMEFMGKGSNTKVNNLLKQLMQPIGHVDGKRAFLKQSCQKEACFGKDKRRRISDLEFPVCCMGMIYSYFHTENKCYYARGSGCLIGPSLVLTCTHNLYCYQLDKRADKVQFYPALNGEYNKSDAVDFEYFQYHPKYEKTEANMYDLAILKLKDDIGEKYGYLGVDFSQQNIKQRQSFMMYGYSQFQAGYSQCQEGYSQYQGGYSQRQGNTSFAFMHESPGVCMEVNQNILTYEETTKYGQSGGPIIVERDGRYFIVGVHIGNYRTNKKNIANCLNKQKIGWIISWSKNTYCSNLNEQYQINFKWQSARDITNFLSNMNGEKSILDLNLQTCQINSETLKKLAASKLISIKKLNLSFNQISNDGIEFLGIKYFPNLKKLSLFKNELKTQAVEQIIKYVNLSLEELDLGLNEIGDDQGFSYLHHMSSLQILKLACIGLTEKGLNNLKICMQVHTINLSGNKIGNRILSIIKKWECRLRQIDISDNSLTDAVFEEVDGQKIEGGEAERYKGHFPFLKKLSLQRNQLSDECANSFPQLYSLKWLDLRINPNLTEQCPKKISEKYQYISRLLSQKIQRGKTMKDRELFLYPKFSKDDAFFLTP